MEIVVGSLKWYDPNFPSHHIRAVDSQNNFLWEYALDAEPTAVVVADIDADGKDEILHTAGSELVAMNVDMLPLGVEPVEWATLPDGYELTQNYPNPFNPSTTMRFALPHTGFDTLKVYSVIGEEVPHLWRETTGQGCMPYGGMPRDFQAASTSAGSQPDTTLKQEQWYLSDDTSQETASHLDAQDYLHALCRLGEPLRPGCV